MVDYLCALFFTDVEFQFTQPLYTVIENSTFAVVVVQLTNGVLNRPINFSVTPNSFQAIGMVIFIYAVVYMCLH